MAARTAADGKWVRRMARTAADGVGAREWLEIGGEKNKMQPTNPKWICSHSEQFSAIVYLNSLVYTYFPCYQSAVWSVKCGVWSVKCSVWSVKWEVWSVKCGVRSVECKVWSVQWVKCGVWSVECGV